MDSFLYFLIFFLIFINFWWIFELFLNLSNEVLCLCNEEWFENLGKFLKFLKLLENFQFFFEILRNFWEFFVISRDSFENFLKFSKNVWIIWEFQFYRQKSKFSAIPSHHKTPQKPKISKPKNLHKIPFLFSPIKI